MSITFPDGTSADIVSPASIDLGSEYVAPLAYLKGGPGVCGAQVYFTRSELVGSHILNAPPLAVFEGVSGEPVGLWRSKRWAEPHSILAYDFGDWVAALFCQADPSTDSVALGKLAQRLDARPTGDGMLILEPLPPLRFIRGEHGPSVLLESGDEPFRLVELTVSGCSVSPAEIAPGGGTAHGCFAGGIELYALGGPRFLRAVTEGVEVRNVTPPGG